jgi:SAM-dependent methyltransferase
VGQPGFHLPGAAAERYERTVAPIMAPFVDAVLNAGNVGPGHAVLDVACGTGFAARAAAARVGPAGRVAGVDNNQAMLDVAAVASASQLPAIEWCAASADGLPFPAATFDVVICQQGMQFFPDLRASAAEVARVVREGGRVAATVWSPLGRSPYFVAQSRAVEQVVGARASGYFADAFGCAEEQVMAAFRAAGLVDVTGREVVADIRISSPAAFVRQHLLSTPWGLAAAEARPDGVDQATATVLDLLSPYRNPDGSLTTPFASMLVAGTRRR